VDDNNESCNNNNKKTTAHTFLNTLSLSWENLMECGTTSTTISSLLKTLTFTQGSPPEAGALAACACGGRLAGADCAAAGAAAGLADGAEFDEGGGPRGPPCGAEAAAGDGLEGTELGVGLTKLLAPAVGRPPGEPLVGRGGPPEGRCGAGADEELLEPWPGGGGLREGGGGMYSAEAGAGAAPGAGAEPAPARGKFEVPAERGAPALGRELPPGLD